MLSPHSASSDEICAFVIYIRTAPPPPTIIINHHHHSHDTRDGCRVRSLDARVQLKRLFDRRSSLFVFRNRKRQYFKQFKKREMDKHTQNLSCNSSGNDSALIDGVRCCFCALYRSNINNITTISLTHSLTCRRSTVTIDNKSALNATCSTTAATNCLCDCTLQNSTYRHRECEYIIFNNHKI